MFSEKFLERVNRLIEIQFAERRKQVPLKISIVKREHAASGSLHSSMTVLRIKETCEREIEIRAILVWQSLVRVIQTLGIESLNDITVDLKQFIRERINSSHAELTELLSQNLMNMMKIDQVSLDEARDHVIAKHEIEIDLYIDTYKKRSEMGGADTEKQSNYHFYGNVGAVQTGPGAEANIVQNLGQDDRSAIEQALALARDAIAAAEEIAEEKRHELVEIVDEATNELGRENPNSTKLQSLLATVATTIQTLASAQPAYQALKGALIPLGIMLP